MDTVKTVLSEILVREKEIGVYRYYYKNFQIWRIYRFDCRNHLLKQRIPRYTNNSLAKKGFIRYWQFLCNFVISFYKLSRLFIKKVDKVDNIVFAFPRLQYLDGMLIDKFTDPVIDKTQLSESVLVFQNSSRVQYSGKRWKNERVISTDCMIFLSYLWGALYVLFFMFTSTGRTIRHLFNVTRLYFNLNYTNFFMWNIKFCSFLFLTKVYNLIFKRLNCKRLFLVDRAIFLPQIFVAHSLHLLVYEFQHGVTCSDTPLYSGPYDPVSDPDYFLAFGEIWKGRQFAIPIERILNIGWAYKDLIMRIPVKNMHSQNDVLVISSPGITEKIVYTVVDLAKCYKLYNFYIRCHPQEMMSEELKDVIAKNPNIYIADNRIDSFMALRSYIYVIGENSSVLYEALSLGRRVGRFSYNGFSLLHLENIVGEDGFYYLNGVSDFANFINWHFDVKRNCSMYADLNSDLVNDLLK